jgi:hypothetical protein
MQSVDAEFQDAGTVTRASMKIPFFLKESASVARLSQSLGCCAAAAERRSEFGYDSHRGLINDDERGDRPKLKTPASNLFTARRAFPGSCKMAWQPVVLA